MVTDFCFYHDGPAEVVNGFFVQHWDGDGNLCLGSCQKVEEVVL